MGDKKKPELEKEELDSQEGELLPDREEMAWINMDPDPLPVADPGPAQPLPAEEGS